LKGKFQKGIGNQNVDMSIFTPAPQFEKLDARMPGCQECQNKKLQSVGDFTEFFLLSHNILILAANTGRA
jgi:hypothetical protein